MDPSNKHNINQEVDKTLEALSGLQKMKLPEGFTDKLMAELPVQSESDSPWFIRIAAAVLVIATVLNFTVSNQSGDASADSYDIIQSLNWTDY